MTPQSKSPKSKKVVRAFAVLTDRFISGEDDFLCTMIYSDERMAQGKAQHNYDDKVVPCEIHFTAPRRKVK